MTTTISGHTIPVRDMDHSDRLHAYANTLDQDQLERWLYAGAPETRVHYVTNNAYSGLVCEMQGLLVGFLTDGPDCDCRAILRELASGGDIDNIDFAMDRRAEEVLEAQRSAENGGKEEAVDLSDTSWIATAIAAISEDGADGIVTPASTPAEILALFGGE